MALKLPVYKEIQKPFLKKTTKKIQNCFGDYKKHLSLHPQSRNDGGIAQLVRAHDS